MTLNAVVAVDARVMRQHSPQREPHGHAVSSLLAGSEKCGMHGCFEYDQPVRGS